jgi:hypothetical protein
MYAVAVGGSTVFAGGYFDGAGGLPRNGLAAINVKTNEILDWNPGASGEIKTLLVVGNTVYVGGAFNAISGQPRGNLAAIDARTGALLPWRPYADSYVATMFVNGSALHVGGQFWSIAGVYRSYLAAVDLVTGDLLPWNPGIDGHVLAFARRDSTLYIGGAFQTLAGQPRYCLGAVNLRTGAGLPFNPSPNSLVTSLAVRDDYSQRLYVGGGFSTMMGASRHNLAAVDLSTGIPMSWNPGPNGWVNFLQIAGSTVRVGGDYNQIGGQNRAGFALVDGDAGAILPPNANVAGPVSSYLLKGNESYLAGELWSEATTRPLYWSGLMRLVNPTSFSAVAATALYPNGGETLPIGAQVPLRWTASGGLPEVKSVDLYLSRSGTGGPWELIAAGTANDGVFDWVAKGPTVQRNAYLRVDARDWNGVITSDRSNAGFTISEAATPTLVEMFRAAPVEGGVEIEWEVSDAGALAWVELQRGVTAQGEFLRVDAAPRTEGSVTRVLDPVAPPNGTWWYRLAGMRSGGSAFASPPIEVKLGSEIIKFALVPVAPNPTRGTATVSYALPRATHIRLSIVDVQGRELSVLTDAVRPAGLHVTTLAATDLPAGLSFLNLRAAGVSLTRRMAIVK